MPVRDPAAAVLGDPQVPERRRFCARCDAPVGRSRPGRPGRTEGFCTRCGASYSFTPKLRPADLVGGQYEVLGCLAHGGLGWIYLARDHNVSDRWVVLKGLLNSDDAAALAAIVTERRFLAEVEHPSIVRIYNFVRHPDPGTGVPVGYIVMEYVGGRSLRELRADRRMAGTGPMPVEQAIAYALEMLPALDYLHGRGLLYCDFKPDNVIQTEEQVKLIDLGGVRRIDDDDSPIYGTVGYQAPEVATQGPSIASELYTVGRTLAVLTTDFAGFTGRWVHELPGPGEVPLFARHEPFHRLLARATHPDPDRRFESATEMATQLTGVLREILAAADGQPRPAPSTLFGPEVNVPATDPTTHPTPAEVAAALPLPYVDVTDPAAGFLAGIIATEPADLIAALSAVPVASAEVRLRVAHARILLGDAAGAGAQLDAVDADDWRVTWYRALSLLATGDAAGARPGFVDCYDRYAGEAAPKLALAVCAALTGRHVEAAGHLERVWRTDRSYLSAAFGLARARLQTGDRDAAVAALAEVPVKSKYIDAAHAAAVRVHLTGRAPHELTRADLLDAGARLDDLASAGRPDRLLAAQLLEAALGWVRAGSPGPTDTHGNGPGRLGGSQLGGSQLGGSELGGSELGGIELAGTAITERELRLALERVYRVLAKHAPTRADRVALVVRANAARPWTVV